MRIDSIIIIISSAYLDVLDSTLPKKVSLSSELTITHDLLPRTRRFEVSECLSELKRLRDYSLFLFIISHF